MVYKTLLFGAVMAMLHGHVSSGCSEWVMFRESLDTEFSMQTDKLGTKLHGRNCSKNQTCVVWSSYSS